MKSLLALVAAIAAALVLCSCSNPAAPTADGHEHGTESSAPGLQPAPNSAADVAFASGMIPHHEQAVQMSGLVAQRSTNPALIALAADIAAEQGPEIQTLKAFLSQWGGDSEGSGHDDHQGATNGMEMQGMVDDTTMARLESLKGNDFDVLWLNSMIGHHQGAIAMANTEIAEGVNVDAKTLAQQIVTAQTAEIAQMKKMGMLTHDG